MNTPGLSNQRLASDPGSLNALKFSAGQEGDKGKAALKETAKQFEALFMRELIKSMREATMKSGLLEGEGGNLGNDLLDQQFAVQLSGMPGGLSGAIERQLSRQMAPAEPAAAADAAKAAPVANAAPMASTVSRASGGTRQAGFVDQHSQAAAQVARESGIPASYMIGQA
ncbi:MAG: rod-binding protein, partial [Hydrogenophaga sp.]|nr:rod-binding protein [Hydrogenophaga sp.]